MNSGGCCRQEVRRGIQELGRRSEGGSHSGRLGELELARGRRSASGGGAGCPRARPADPGPGLGLLPAGSRQPGPPHPPPCSLRGLASRPPPGWDRRAATPQGRTDCLPEQGAQEDLSPHSPPSGPPGERRDRQGPRWGPVSRPTQSWETPGPPEGRVPWSAAPRPRAHPRPLLPQPTSAPSVNPEIPKRTFESPRGCTKGFAFKRRPLRPTPPSAAGRRGRH